MTTSSGCRTVPDAEFEEPVVVTSMRLSVRLHDRLKDLAVSEHRTVSQQVRHLIEAAVTARERRLERAQTQQREAA